MTTQIDTALELDDIQAAALMPRPHPYAGSYVAVRIDDRNDGRELLRRLIPLLDPVSSYDPTRPVSLGVALSYSGLEALGVPEQALATFPAEFREGMAARADYIGDVGENAPEHWEAPLGSKDVHLVVTALAQDTAAIANDVQRPFRRFTVGSGSSMATNLPCYSRDASVGCSLCEAFSRCGQPTINGARSAQPGLLNTG